MLNLTKIFTRKTRSDQPQFAKTIYLIKSKSYPTRYMAKLWYAEKLFREFYEIQSKSYPTRYMDKLWYAEKLFREFYEIQDLIKSSGIT